MRTLILNSSNIIDSSNGLFQFNFTSGSVSLVAGQKLALASIQMYYSNFNITSSYGNNQLSYTWIDGSVVNITIPDGYLDIPGLNNYLRFIMVQNKHYYTDASGKYIYLIDIQINQSRYGVDIITYSTSQTIEATKGWSKPSGATWTTPSTNASPTITISTNFGKLIGFTAGTYGSTTSSSLVSQSTITPQITPVGSYILTCSLIKNNYATPTNLLYSFSPNASFGNRISVAPNEFAWIDIQPGNYNTFTLQILDQDYRSINFKDPNTVIMLVISDANERI